MVNTFDKNQEIISEVIDQINQANDLRDQVLDIMNKLFQESQVFEKQSKEVVNLIKKQRERIEIIFKKTQAIKKGNAALLDGSWKENWLKTIFTK